MLTRHRRPLTALCLALLITATFYPGIWTIDTYWFWNNAEHDVYYDWYPFGLVAILGLFGRLGALFRFDFQTTAGLFTLLQCFLYWWSAFWVAHVLSRGRWGALGSVLGLSWYLKLWEISVAQTTDTWGTIFFMGFVGNSILWARDSKSLSHYGGMVATAFAMSATRHELGLAVVLFFCGVVAPYLVSTHREMPRVLLRKKIGVGLLGICLALAAKSAIVARLKSDPRIHTANLFLSYDFFGTLFFSRVKNRELEGYASTAHYGLPRMRRAIQGYGYHDTIDYLFSGEAAPFSSLEMMRRTTFLADFPRAVWANPWAFFRHKMRVWRNLLQLGDPYAPHMGAQTEIPPFRMKEASYLPALRSPIFSFLRWSRYRHPFQLFYRHGYLLLLTLTVVAVSLVGGGVTTAQKESLGLTLGAAAALLLPPLVVTPSIEWRYLTGFHLFLCLAALFSVRHLCAALAPRVALLWQRPVAEVL